VASSLDDDAGEAQVGEVVQHRAVQHLGEAEDGGNGQLETEAQVLKRVGESDKGRAAAAGGVEVEEDHLAALRLR
jgi:hypothetical protein